MANELTGAFDAVVQLGLRGLNRLLAAQHQQPDVCPHSSTIRVDDENEQVHATAQVQISTPSASLPADDSAASLTVHYGLRAHVFPDAGSAAVPEAVHGELAVTLPIVRLASDAEDLLELEFGADDLELRFSPDPGAPLSEDENVLVTALIRNHLQAAARERPVNAVIGLPERGDGPGIRHWAFKTMPDDQRPAVALLLKLQGDAPAPEDAAGVSESLLADDADFAIAVSQEYLESQVSAILKLSPRSFEVPITIQLFWLRLRATYRVSLDLEGLTLEFTDGAIQLRLRGSAVSDTFWAPDFAFRLEQDLSLDIADNSVRLVPDGDLDLQVDGFLAAFYRERVRDSARQARDEMLDRANETIREMLAGPEQHPDSGLFGDFLDALRVSFEVEYTSAEIRKTGVVIQGRAEFGEWPDVVASFEQTITQDLLARPPVYTVAFNARESWIPGGTIERFRWVYGNDQEVEQEISEEHRFLTSFTQEHNPLQIGVDENGLARPHWWCLEVHGTQGLLPSGEPREVTGNNCGIGFPRPPDLLVPGLGGGSIEVPDGDDGVFAHIDPFAGFSPRPQTRLPRHGTNLIVHFAGGGFPSSLAVLRDALAARARKAGAVFIVAVVPRGPLEKSLAVDPNVVWARTEDLDGAWAKALQVSATPATVLIDPQGRIVWRDVGTADLTSLKAGLDRHLVLGGRPAWRLLQPKLRRGDTAADFAYEHVAGRRVAFRTLRGRSRILCFWRSWSAPCLEELRRLQGLQTSAAGKGAVILAINDGEPPGRATECFAENALSLHLVSDPGRQIAARYGINCWPTTLQVDGRGRIAHIKLGRGHASHSHARSGGMRPAT